MMNFIPWVIESSDRVPRCDHACIFDSIAVAVDPDQAADLFRTDSSLSLGRLPRDGQKILASIWLILPGAPWWLFQIAPRSILSGHRASFSSILTIRPSAPILNAWHGCSRTISSLPMPSPGGIVVSSLSLQASGQLVSPLLLTEAGGQRVWEGKRTPASHLPLQASGRPDLPPSFLVGEGGWRMRGKGACRLPPQR
jgi:hypothetical protein